MIKMLRIVSEIQLHPACPARLAAVMVPTSLGGAHSHRTAGPTDTGLLPTENNAQLIKKACVIKARKV